MATSLKEPGTSTTGRPASGAVALHEISFVDEAPAAAAVVREFSQPRRARAVKTALAAATLGEASAGTSGLLAFVPADAGTASLESVRAKLAGGTREPPKVAVKHGAELVEYWPGRALLQAPAEGRAEVEAAVVDFMFYEGELRELERIVGLGENQALADLEVGHRVRQRDRRRWEALFDAMQRYTRARLVFARLEPELSIELSPLSSAARRWLGRLYDAALIEDRAEALNFRLEALEDFYEAATQRVADFRWYREGRVLEVTIILILVLECLLMAGEIYFHFVSGGR
jgi:hypothetical protein